MKKALITGISGQDGFYLARYLLDLGYEVHGITRRHGIARRAELEGAHNHSTQENLLGMHERMTLHFVNFDNCIKLYQLLASTPFDECYHLAASSYVGERLSDGNDTIQNNISITHMLLKSLHELQPSCRVYFAGSSEMFGRPSTYPQSETTSLNPRSAYGISKVAGYHIVRNYRESYGMFCGVGILYNHESPRRSAEFVTRKITKAVARIKAGQQQTLELGSLEARRDWGFAPDYVQTMHAILNHQQPDDFVVATGVLHSVGELCELAFSHAGLDWEKHVLVNPKFNRVEADIPLVGCAKKINTATGWQPQTSFAEMVRIMVDADVKLYSGKPA